MSDDGTACVTCQTPLDLGAVNYWRLDQADLTDPVLDTGTATTKANGQYLGGDEDVTLGTTTEAADGNKGMTLLRKITTSGVLVEPYEMPTDAFSVSMWVKIEPTTSQYTLFSYASLAGTANAFTIFHPASTELASNFRLIVGATDLNTTNLIKLDTGAWRMLVVTWDSDTRAIQAYVDGEKVLEAEHGVAFTAPGRLYFGQEQDGAPPGGPALDASQSLVGDLDDVAVFDRVLTAAEIKEQYRGYRCQ